MPFAFLFPGQGSQSVGMLGDLTDKYKVIGQTFKEASKLLDQDLWQMSLQGPEAELNRTVNAQPILLTASVALWRLWLELSDKVPSIMAGHSLGEYSALVCADAIEFKDALLLVQKRATLMQKAVPQGHGAMVAVMGLDAKKINKICTKLKEVEIANLNSPKQTVVAGTKEAIKEFTKLATEAGAKRCIQLAVSVPSHCFLMKETTQPFSEYMDQIQFKQPSIPVVHNVDAEVKTNLNEIKEALVQQLYSSVQWVKTIYYINENDSDCFVEAGPGNVLSGLLKGIDSSFNSCRLKNCESFDKALDLTDEWSV
ncbi:MAG: ACP S-malonyltransferase [Candidatus Oxydemutatoraceae bacterium WSBS_2016_MAG_OTU14]